MKFNIEAKEVYTVLYGIEAESEEEALKKFNAQQHFSEIEELDKWYESDVEDALIVIYPTED